MIKKITSCTALLIINVFVFLSCKQGAKELAYTSDENTMKVPQKLSDYVIYQGAMNDLMPSLDYQLLELSSSLFVNYAEKQRLVKLPTGTQMTSNGNGLPSFPNKTILIKTFYYYKDKRNPTLGKNVIETRVLVKENDIWNVATYVWNKAQNEAFLNMKGLDKRVSWIDNVGKNKSLTYRVPSKNECITCHQSNTKIVPIGPKLMNMNYTVNRNGTSINQLQHLQSIGILNTFDHSQLASLPDDFNLNFSLTERGRAYLDINCAHCHSPSGFPKAAKKSLDFRYSTPLTQTGIIKKRNKISKEMGNREMPYLGTTVLDKEGYMLVKQYLKNQ